MDNIAIAHCLRQHARLLEADRGNLLRVRAYRRAAQMIAELDEPLTNIWKRGGRRGLQALPSIGRTIGRVIDCLVRGP
jgi:DNA polymerase/3'-5' exonuclease PolX